MKIAINILPLRTGHKVRGAGFYTVRLIDALEKHYPDNKYIYFTDLNELTYDIDVIHYPFFDPFFLTLPLNNKFPLVVTVHDLIPLLFPKEFPSGIKGKIKWEIQKRLLKQADSVITDSRSSKEDIKKITGIDDSRVNVVYLAADVKFGNVKKSQLKIRELKRKYRLPDEFVLYVGDVTWNKNLINLIRAIKIVNIPLVMVGKALTQKDFDKENPWNRSLVEINTLLNEDTKIIRLGFIPDDDLSELYKVSRVFVMPSFYEGFGLPILEAMQSGCPVVTSRISSIPEIAEESALYVDPYDVESIASGIKKLFNNDKLQKELSKKGRKQSEKFSWKKTADETINIYENIKKDSK